MSYKEEEYFIANQKLWDQKTHAHVDSDFYNMEAFLAGESSLRKIELAELPDLKGSSVLHSQCHFGQDTISLQRMGAQCTGIDFSEEAIKKARDLNSQLGLDTRFVSTNVYDIDKHLSEQFDLVFTSYGVLGWLPDLDRWAKQMVARIKPSGLFYMAEFHPTMYMYDWETYKLDYPYFHEEVPTMEVESGTYADKQANISMKEYFWQHHLSDILTALLDNGLEILSFQEYDFSPYPIFGKEIKRAEQEYLFQKNGINLPLVFSIKAQKK